MQIWLVEADKKLREALQLNLTTTGGFNVQTQWQKLSSQPRPNPIIIMVNSTQEFPGAAELSKNGVNKNDIRIDYQPLFIKLNEHSSFKQTGPNHFHIRFGLSGLPAIANLVWQIINDNKWSD